MLRAADRSIVLVIAILLATPARAAEFETIPLPNYDWGGCGGPPQISEDGSAVVGTWCNDDHNPEGYLWTEAGGVVRLGDLPGGEFNSDVRGVSADGSIVVGESISAPATWEAFRWTAATGMQGLGDLPGGPLSGIATAITPDGSVIVGSSYSSHGFEAFRWTEAGGMVPLGDLPGGSFYSSTSDVSADGAVVVGSSISGPSSASEPFRWTAATGMVGLGRLPGDTRGGAAATSADGSVVVGATGATVPPIFEYDAFRWTAETGLVPLGRPPGEVYSVWAYDTTADGSIVVGRVEMRDPEGLLRGFAFVWDAAHGIRFLEDVLRAEFGLDLTGWQLELATSITPDGLAIVGTGDFSDPERLLMDQQWVVRFDRQCRDGIDDDGDGLVDLDDPGCADDADTSERSSALACDDGIDQDRDGLADWADPGCASPTDPSESDPAVACDDALDNDGDGLVDLADPACASVTGPTEMGECQNGTDDEGDGFVDADDLGCSDVADASEQSAELACDNGIDDDGDGFVDLADPGGPFSYASPENPQCDDDLDNDGNGLVDFDDPKCTPWWPYWETTPPPEALWNQPCGLGAELALVLMGLRWLRGRTRR